MQKRQALRKRLDATYRAIDRQLNAYSLAEQDVNEAVLYALYREIFALEDRLSPRSPEGRGEVRSGRSEA